MNDHGNLPSPLSPLDDEAKTHALIAYAFMLAGLFTLILWFVGGIWAIVKKPDISGSRFEDHYENIISVFWWGIFWGCLSFLLTLIGLGYVMLFVLFVWGLYRIIKGLAKITSNRAYLP